MVLWHHEVLRTLRAYPDDANKRKLHSIRMMATQYIQHHSIRMMATQYILCGGQLYRRSYDGIHLRCLKREEVKRVMEEVHQGICGPHMNGRMLAKKILRKGTSRIQWRLIVWTMWKVAVIVKHTPTWNMYHLVSYIAWLLHGHSQFGA